MLLAHNSVYCGFAIGHTHTDVLIWAYSKSLRRIPWGLLRLDVAEEAEVLRRSTNTTVPFVTWRQWATAGERDRDTGNLNLTQEALKATQNKLLSSGISPYWKTISTVIRGELV